MRTQKTPYSHTYAMWDTPWGGVEIFEASGSSVKLVSYEQWKKKNTIVFEKSYVVTREEFYLVQKHLRPLLGTPYGVVQVFGIFLAIKLRLKKNPFSDRNGTLICSELIYLILSIIFGKEPKQRVQDLVTPLSIYRMVTNGES